MLLRVITYEFVEIPITTFLEHMLSKQLIQIVEQIKTLYYIQILMLYLYL